MSLPSPSREFSAALAAAVEVLRGLPRAPSDVDDAKARLEAFANEHRAVSPDFLVDLAPGAIHADFDLYLAHPEGGTVALSYRDDGGRPWFVEYSSHWATDRVLQVGDAYVSIQEAIFALQYLGESNPNVLGPLVRDALLTTTDSEDWSDTTLDVTDDELQAAADAFRRKHGLESAADTHAWLDTMGWSLHRFRSVLAGGLRLRKLEDRLVREKIEPHFADHCAEYEIVRTFRTVTDRESIARDIAREAATSSLMSAAESFAMRANGGGTLDGTLDGTLATARSFQLGAALVTAPVGSIVQERDTADRFVVTQILSRAPATLDAATRRVVRERLIEAWVEDRKREVRIQWHWT